MGKARLSIGDDTATGEPENGPRGPYTTDKDEDIRSSTPRDQRPAKQPLPSRTETEITKKSSLGSDR